jgi:hypothetical protein
MYTVHKTPKTREISLQCNLQLDQFNDIVYYLITHSAHTLA